MLGTSQYGANDQKESKSRSRTESFFVEETHWKFRSILQQDNDIDAEIEVFDSISNSNPQTTAKFIKVQIKSTDNAEINLMNQEITYIATPKFVRFCYHCDIPIILLIHDIPKKTAYYVWMQKYIYEVLEKNNPAWRSNTSGITLKINILKMLSKGNLTDLRSIAFNGTTEILDMRRRSSYGVHQEQAQKSIKIGSLFYANLDNFFTGIRPVYVASIPSPNKVIVCPLTSNTSKKFIYGTTGIYLDKKNISILPKDSVIMISKICVIEKHELLDYLGTVPQELSEVVSQKIKSLF